jgi:hemerythrin-like domain-containing protein
MSIHLDSLRSDHIEILSIIAEIQHFLEPETIKQKATAVQNLVARLTQKTLSHLLLEDRFFCQEMLISTHDETRNLAQQHIANMGSMATQLKDYIQTWQSEDDIRLLPERFCVESKSLLNFLQQRINREEQVLYPKAEAIL